MLGDPYTIAAGLSVSDTPLSEFTNVLAIDLMEIYPLSVYVTGRYFFLIILLELSAGYVTPYL